jgi:hypothetical protein
MKIRVDPTDLNPEYLLPGPVLRANFEEKDFNVKYLRHDIQLTLFTALASSKSNREHLPTVVYDGYLGNSGVIITLEHLKTAGW